MMTSSTQNRAAKALWIVALSALAGFGAVYVILSSPDNESPAGKKLAALQSKSSPMVAFVKRQPPQPLPDIVFQDAEGKDVKLSSFKGKTILLNLWATWCTPCREEMPSLDRLQKAMGGDKFDVVALSLDRGGYAAARKFLDELKTTSVKLYIDSAVKQAMQLNVAGMPTSILIDKSGLEYGRLAGAAPWDSDDAKKIIEAAMQ